MVKYRQFKKKLEYADHTYQWKRKFHGKEKPDIYDLLKKHTRRAITDVINNIPKHHKVVSRDKYFVVTYNTQAAIFSVLSLITGKEHINTNHRGRLQEIASKERYLKGRLKFRSTEKLEEFGADMRNYADELNDLENKYEALSFTTIEDVLAELLYNVSFTPLGKIVSPEGRREKSLELKTKDLASNTWVDGNGGISLDSYADALLKEANTNGLSEVGYAVHESEYGDGGSVSQMHDLKDAIRDFISHYTSSSSYIKAKKARIREIESKLLNPNKDLWNKYGLYIDKRNCWLLLVVIDEILNERNPDRTKQFMPDFLPPIETSAGSLDDLLFDAGTYPKSSNDDQEELPF